MNRRSLVLPCLLALAITGIASPAPSTAQDSRDFAINGPLYKKVVQLKDLIADILPPPAYIIESHLVVHELIDAVESGADAKTVADLVEYGRKLKEGSSAKAGEFAGYFERIDFWVKDLPSNKPEYVEIREWMLTKSVEPAKAYYAVRDTKFIPALGNAATAKEVLRKELKPLYEQHRVAVDGVVLRANAIIKKLEREVVTLVSKGEYANILIGGALYNDIIRMKDLISDILPPPRYIIESHLVNLMLIDLVESGDKTAAGKLIDWGRQLKEGMSLKKELPGYMERQTFWKANLSDKSDVDRKIKDLMIKATFEPAVKFFDLRDAQFTPAIQKGDVAAAKKLNRESLIPLYREHRKQIDELVTRTNESYEAVMKEVSGKIAK